MAALDRQLLEQIHHVVKIGICLIKLNGGELGIVLGVHALVAEDAAYLVHTLDAADNKALQITARSQYAGTCLYPAHCGG